MARASVVNIAEPAAVAHQSSTGSALSELGVKDIYADLPEEPKVPADPIKPAAYLRGEDIPDRPRSLSDHASEDADEPTTISGPSFLGLTDDSDQSSYLLDDDQPRRSRGLLVFCLFALAIFAGIGYLEWQTMQTGRLSIPFISKTLWEQPTNSSTPSTQNQGTAGASKTPTPQSGNTEANNDSLATSDNDNAKNGPVNPVPGAAGAASDSNAKPLTEAANSGTNEEGSTSQATPAEKPKPTGQAAAAAGDQDATETSQSRQSKDAADQSKNEDNSADNQKPSVARKAKPSARAASVEKDPDPRQNRMLLLGERYLYGHGVPQNCNQALTYFRGAADENNAPAMAHLGAMYASGQCVTLNRVMAFNWFARAQNAQPSDQWLQRNMNMLWRDMTPQERTAINK